MARDYYDVLGVGRDASPDELQSAFRRLARRYHPDVNKDPDAGERFREVSEAYDVLSDPADRSKYDRFGHDYRRVSPEYADAAAAGRGGPRGPSGRGGARSGTAGRGASGINIEDILSGMGDFGDLFGRGPFGGGGPIPGADQEAVIELSVEEAYSGGTRTITLTGPGGERSFTVTIPPGVTEGQRIRLAGQGGRPGPGGTPGDLYLVVHLKPHDRYRVEGRNVFVDLPLAPWEAALGASVKLPAPGGDVTVTVPAGTSSGRSLRLAGQGLPNPRGKPGDLLASVRIMVPPRLSRRERELFEELAATSGFDPRATG
ncbi:MAG TPA: DnaJ C-terminal domain-containing protein [Frankiaceae bacterium]